MPFDVFISHSNVDRSTANAAVHVLESRGIRCWIAPRDIEPGSNWGASIIAGLSECRVFVLIFSKSSNGSQQVLQEVERAVAKGLIVVPVRVEPVDPSPSLELYIGARHWLDAMSAPLEAHLHRLADSVERVLGRAGGVQAPATAAAPQPAAVVAPHAGPRKSESTSSPSAGQGPSSGRHSLPATTSGSTSERRSQPTPAVGAAPGSRSSTQSADPVRPSASSSAAAPHPVATGRGPLAVAPPPSDAWKALRRGMYGTMALLVALGGIAGAWAIAPNLGLRDSTGERGLDSARSESTAQNPAPMATQESNLAGGSRERSIATPPVRPSAAQPTGGPPIAPGVGPAASTNPPRDAARVGEARPASAASGAPVEEGAALDWRTSPIVDIASGSTEIATTLPRARPVFRRLELDTPATVGLSMTASQKKRLAVARFGLDRNEDGRIDDRERLLELDAANDRTGSGSYVVPAGRYLLALESEESAPILLRVAVTPHRSSESKDPGQTPEDTGAAIPTTGDHEITEHVGLRANIDLADWYRLEVASIAKLTCFFADTKPYVRAVLVRDRNADRLLAPDEAIASLGSETTGTSMVEYLAPGKYAIGVLPVSNNDRPSQMYTLKTRVEVLSALPVDPGGAIDSAMEVAIATGSNIEVRDGIGAADAEDLFKLVAAENLVITLYVEASDARHSGFSRSVLCDRDGNGLLDREMDLMRSGEVRGEESRRTTLALEKGRPLYLSITRDPSSARFMPYGLRVVAVSADSAELDAPSKLDKGAPAIQVGQKGKPVHGYVGPGDKRDVLVFRVSTPSDVVVSAQSGVSQVLVELVHDRNGNGELDNGERISHCEPGPGSGRKIEQRLSERGDYFIVVTDRQADSRQEAAGTFYSVSVTATKATK